MSSIIANIYEISCIFINKTLKSFDYLTNKLLYCENCDISRWCAHTYTAKLRGN